MIKNNKESTKEKELKKKAKGILPQRKRESRN